jgi:hypothetical protein
MPPLRSALQPSRRIALHASVARALSAASTKFMHRCHVGLSSVAEKQQAWDVRERELNFN